MDWRTTLVTLCLVLYADGFSKYGRTCKDIGCLNSEVCVLAEDPCSYGRTSNCGTYPTCKKKSLVEGSHSEPVQPAAPRPTPAKPSSSDFDSPPNYAPPAAPGAPYGGNTHNGGGSPYGGSNPYGGESPYGGSSGGGSPYGGGSSGGGSPYGGGSSGGGSPYGGGSSGGGSPYGGGSSGGGSPYGGGSSGGGSPYGGGSSYGGNAPYGGNTNRGGSNPYGGNSPYGGSSSGGSGSHGSPLDSILSTINKYANSGGGGGSSGGQGSGGSGLSNIFGNILGNLSKSGGLNNLFNTRPIQENPNYSSYGSNSRSSNPQTYPSGTQQTYQNRNYGQSNAHRGGATTHKPVSYGWNVGVTVILTYLIHQYIQTMIRR